MTGVKTVLWTGGWDSTFRVIQLYKRGIDLQPLYVIDSERPSTKKEIETIKRLSKEIQEKFTGSSAKIHPIKFIKKEDIPFDLFLRIMHKIVKRRQGMGKQYYWLACLAKKYKGLEIGLIKHEEERGWLVTSDELTEIKDESLNQNWIVNTEKMDFFKAQIFKNARFPLVNISKLEMKKEAEENDFMDIMEKTWFCHFSNNKPCGQCNPCKQYVIDGFGFRLQS